MPESARIRLALWVATAALLAGGLLAVPVVGENDTPAATGQWVGTVGGPTTTAPVASLTGDGGDAAPPAAGDAMPSASEVPAAAPAAGRPVGAAGGGAPASTTPTTSPPTTAAPTTAPAEDLGAPQDPGPAKPPRAGTYRYKATRGGEPLSPTTAIEDRGTTSGETRQLQKLRGEGLDSDNDVAWRGDGVRVLSSVILFGESRGSCDWEPDTLQLRLPIVKGATWESTSTCSMTGLTPAPIPVTRKITGRFVELRRVRVAGQVVDVWAIDGTEHTEAAGTVMDRSGITLFSPKHGIAVSASGKVKTSGGPNGPEEHDYTSEIQNLDPE